MNLFLYVLSLTRLAAVCYCISAAVDLIGYATINRLWALGPNKHFSINYRLLIFSPVCFENCLVSPSETVTACVSHVVLCDN